MVEIRFPVFNRSIVFNHETLQGAHLVGFNFHRADMQGINLTGAILRNASLDGAALRGTILDGCDLRNAKLVNAGCQNMSAVGADFRYAMLGSIFTGANLCRANFNQATVVAGTDFSGAQLQGADMRAKDIHLAKLDGAVYSRATRWPPFFRPEQRGAVLDKSADDSTVEKKKV